MKRLFDYLDQRAGFTKMHRRVLDRPVPARINYVYCFGGITFTLSIVLLVTGLLLAVHFTPSEAEAYRSIQRLHRDVPLGGVLRSVHHWAANLMVVRVLLHMLRVFITGSYKNPRELNWMTEAILFLLTLGYGFTGYLLPWDQKAYWATVVGTNMAGSVPLAGTSLLSFIRRGGDVTGQTLLRFYSMHILRFPLLTGLFLWGSFRGSRRCGSGDNGGAK